MPRTLIDSNNIATGGVARSNLNTTIAGSAVITKLLAGKGLALSAFTGADAGTGDVTLAVDPTVVTSGFRTRVINGNFKINQRVVSGTVTLAAGAYGHDRWKAGSSGCSYTFATNGIDVVVTITAGSLLQVLQATTIEGGTYTLSWSGTATGRVYQSGTPSFASSPQQATLSASVTTTVEFSTGTVSNVQLEPGSAATLFERHPPAAELLLCQRFYYKTYAQNVAPGTATSGYGPVYNWFPGLGSYYTLPFLFPTPMFAVPSVMIYSAQSGASGYLNNGGTDVPAYVVPAATTGVSVSVNNTSMQGGLTGHIVAIAEN